MDGLREFLKPGAGCHSFGGTTPVVGMPLIEQLMQAIFLGRFILEQQNPRIDQQPLEG